MIFGALIDCIDRGEACVWVGVSGARGSVPRGTDAGMVVSARTVTGTIGGGHLEWKAIEFARERLELGQGAATRRHYPLGPALGQCCGGAVDLLYRPVSAAHRAWVLRGAELERSGGSLNLVTRLDGGADHTRMDGCGADAGEGCVTTRHDFNPWHVWIFGAGHVGRALLGVLSTLPCMVTLVDSRQAEMPATLPTNATTHVAEDALDLVDDVPAVADVLVLTHSHALDFEIVRALLQGSHTGFLGVIGSTTKATLFRRRLAARGFDAARSERMTCPIGTRAFGDKHPGSIALDVAATLWQRRCQQRVAHAPAATARDAGH
ncbi:MAG: xanthine dehydrogenase accessory protein XdhC [Burkholderiales bacterium]|nr:xanthine dehydrogenase accessory protein XdhC [Burkholderiales bacterium]